MRTFEGFEELYMPFEPLLFFGAELNSDLYGYRILAGIADDLHVFVWDHESDSRTATAFGLERYLRGERWHLGPLASRFGISRAAHPITRKPRWSGAFGRRRWAVTTIVGG